MGLLDKLWDDVVAGPMPEQGLGRLRHPAHHHHHEPPLAGEQQLTEKEAMARLLQRRRSADFQRVQEEARRVVAQEESGDLKKKPANLGLLRTNSLPDAHDLSSSSNPSTPTSSSGGTPRSVEHYNVWRSVFNPGSNKAMEKMGAQDKFDQAQPNSPTVYDWLYSGETKSTWR